MTPASVAFPLMRPLLHALDAETAHGLTIRMLRMMPRRHQAGEGGRLAIDLFGLRFPNPLGLAAGFDKNAQVPDAMLALGFGFVEVGTLTPRPQAGNARPRLFRLAEDRAVINRMGFNNEGHDAALARLMTRSDRAGVVGVNIGANKDSDDRIADYVRGIEVFSMVASYFTVNISSPNTPGLRALQSRMELEALLARLNDARAKQARRPPMLLKIAPDLREDELADVATACGGGAVDGVIVSNTTLERPRLRSAHAAEQGGLSGEPLLDLSTRQLARFYLLTEGRIPLIGAGGVHDGASALLKIRAGASLVQIYSALVYSGPGLVEQILDHLARELARLGETVGSLRGRDAALLSHHSGSGT